MRDDETIGSTDPDPLLDQLEAASSSEDEMIAKLAHETTLSEYQAAIVVYHYLGHSPDGIGDKLARAAYSIEQEINELRRERQEIADKLEKLQRTAAALDEL